MSEPIPPVDAIIFDCEGVVVDSEPVWDLGQAEFLRRHGRVYDRASIKPRLTGRSLLEGTRLLQEVCALEGGLEELTAERLAIVRELFADGVGFVWGFQEFFEDVRDAHRTALATALTPELLAVVDRRLGLADLFDDRIYDIETVGCRSKPHPDIFLHAAEQLGSDPRGCVVIEDAPQGIEAARRAGMATIALASTHRRDELADADMVVDSFAEISMAKGQPGSRR
ncbi:MAG: HAD family phosphatase [Gemmatimonadetes bacterium]|uniref:HAD family phosphatase n=1 Tax=Candidatus Kutchimonas denitrificans TaxID=3056748 RepID=A0AAE5C8W6_9BACT|nr:HAD family phosphatase [Gemmatimonadota bacterium]NIR74866.1 HAD family phosphatase [Candidatus Kutchimonas denitrificans]NIR99977.1 HAD family phosphatase [Gemmatimonadota bacterium]NIT65561.1 HAD family phosphatase [Gemmatimonadota bacterium]NIU52531.1 HAD-IA family hydrolase [Gemmatimonadota bacterium]